MTRAPIRRLVADVTIACIVLTASACVPVTIGTTADGPLERIHVLRSIREPQSPIADWCAASKTGFEPYPADAQRDFSFWSVQARAADGRVENARIARVAGLRACFGPTSDRARQNFYAEGSLGGISFRGNGECLALMLEFPEPGLFPVRCHLVLSGMPAPYKGGLLTTNTMTSRESFGADSNPSGYTQASIATIRLWRERPR